MAAARYVKLICDSFWQQAMAIRASRYQPLASCRDINALVVVLWSGCAVANRHGKRNSAGHALASAVLGIYRELFKRLGSRHR